LKMYLMPSPIRVSYCTAADGVRLAYRTVGTGPPIIKAANWLGNVQGDARLQATRHWIDKLSMANTLTYYDARGCGLSDRDVDEVTLDAWVRDLEAVADATGQQRFVLLGISQGAAISVRYAVKHPERVAALVLYGGFARGILKQGVSMQVKAASREMIRLAELGWGNDTRAFRQLFSSRIFLDAPEQLVAEFDECHRNSVTGEMAARYLQAFYEIDVCAEAGCIQCPVLAMHSEGDRTILASEGEFLASLIPHAKWVPVPGRNHLPLDASPAWQAINDAVTQFLATVELSQSPAAAPTLTPRQREVLVLVAAGLADKEIARRLNLSPRTVEMHVAGALGALACRSRAQAVARAQTWRLLD
jgi:pimeloyl-ACP methyl ester carboxylesterase/DNA-binding CsgD family transcriptional regulator